MTKIAGSKSGSGSGSISKRHGSADPDPNPHQNVMDPDHYETLSEHFVMARGVVNVIRTAKPAAGTASIGGT